MATDATGTPTTLGIPKFLTSADAPSGNGGNAQMDSIDALIQARVNRPAGVSGGDVPVWNGTTFVVPGGSRNGGRFLRDDGTWAIAQPQILLRAGGLSLASPYITVTNTLTLSDVFGVQGSGINVPGGYLGSTGTIRLKVLMNIFNNTGGTQTFSFGVKYGAGSSSSFSLSAATSATVNTPVILEATIQGCGASNLQTVFGSVFQGGISQGTIPQTVGGDPGYFITTDSTTNQNLRTTVGLGTASANFTLKVMSAYVEVL